MAFDYTVTYGLCSLVFALFIYPFSRKWTRGATKFNVEMQLVSTKTTTKDFLVQMRGEEILPSVNKRRPVFTLIMFNLFIVSLVIGMIPDASYSECKDGTLIETEWVNDGIIDCPDSSDEPDELLLIQEVELNEVTFDFVSNVDIVLGYWGILIAMAGPVFIVFLNSRLVYEYCPVLILDSRNQRIAPFGERKNRWLGPMIGSGAILITLQLIVREGWDSASFSQMGMVLFYLIVNSIAISVGQIVILLMSIKRIKRESHELAVVLLAFRLARPVKMYWDPTERAARQRLMEYVDIPSYAITLHPDLMEKYDLAKEYAEQRKFIEELQQRGGHAATLMGYT